jgi:hypothetical protein
MLTREQYATLKAEAAVAGLSMGELVRRALDQVYRPQARLKVRGWEISVAVWKRPDAAVVGRRVHARPTAREFRTRAAPEPSAANRRTLW